MMYWTCPDCGSSLDFGEQCDCKKEKGLPHANEISPTVNQGNTVCDNYSTESEKGQGNTDKKESKSGQAVDENSLIVVKQLPIIEEQLKAIKERFENSANEALSLQCTEETLKTVRSARADMTHTFNLLEEKRKTAKKTILAPYEAFERIYKECVTDIYAPCDKELAAKIHEVEDGLKNIKRKEAQEYFDEYCTAKHIDFVDFESVKLNVTLNVSKKRLKEQIQAFLDKISDELKLIETQDYYEEIFVEYKKTLNVAQAITIVTSRHKEIEKERQRKEEMRTVVEAQEMAAEKVANAIEAFAPPIVEEEKTIEKLYEVSFTVKGTMEKIKALKAFLVEGEYQYEQN